MNTALFKAWFEGYTAHIKDRVPTEEEWKEICAKIAQLATPSFIPVVWPQPIYQPNIIPRWNITSCNPSPLSYTSGDISETH